MSHARQQLDRILPGSHQRLLSILALGLLILGLLDPGGAEPAGEALLTSRQPLHESGLVAVAPRAAHTVPARPEAPYTPALTVDQPVQRLRLTVESGDNLSLIFKRAGLGPADVHNITSGNSDAAVLTRLYPGDTLAFDIDNGGALNSLELIKSPLESYLFTREPGAAYRTSRILREPHRELVYREAVIDDSLFLAARESGIPARMALEMAGIFNGVIDFILDTRRGDTFGILFEEEYLDGQLIGYGRIMAARFNNAGREFKALRFEDDSGAGNFYNPAGESMRKAFLRNPVDFTRISSDFSLARKHPILNTIRAHRGTDYAAPTGTPVVATADGRVSFAARNGTFGKLVVLQHGGQFETKYAHLNDFARGIKTGARVSQGQVIGYVGATGSATGPHLHYEFLMDGIHRNSRTIHDKLPKAESIADAQLPLFREQTRVLLSMLDTSGAAMQVASNAVGPVMMVGPQPRSRRQ